MNNWWASQTLSSSASQMSLSEKWVCSSFPESYPLDSLGTVERMITGSRTGYCILTGTEGLTKLLPLLQITVS